MKEDPLAPLKAFGKIPAQKSLRFADEGLELVKRSYETNKTLSQKNLSNFHFLLWDFRHRLIQKYFKNEALKYPRHAKHLFGGKFKKQDQLFLEETISKNEHYLGTITIPEVLIQNFKNLQKTIERQTKTNKKNLYIIQKDGDFYLNPNTFINFNKKAKYYKIFSALYSLAPMGGLISFAHLKKAIPNLSKEFIKSDEKFKKYLQNNLTDNHSSFFRDHKIQRKINGKLVFSIPRGTTNIEFNNTLK